MDKKDVKGCPFEFQALEVVLEAICSFLAARTLELETTAYPILHELMLKVSGRNLDQVRKLKNAMTRLIARVHKVRDELENLLDDEIDMAELYLSRKQVWAAPLNTSAGERSSNSSSPNAGSMVSRVNNRGNADDNDVDEVEMLLEAYYMQIDGTANKLATLREYINDTEDYINIQLDSHRNKLIKMEFFISTGTLSLNIYSLIGGIFSMNIKYGWNERHGYMFKWVVIISGILCAGIYLSIISCARRKGLTGP